MTDNDQLEHDLLTPTEVLTYLRVNVRTVYRLMRTGDLPAVRVGHQWRVPRFELDAWLRRQQPQLSTHRRPPFARDAGAGGHPTRVPPSEDGDFLHGDQV